MARITKDLGDHHFFDEFRRRLSYLSWHKFRIQRSEAEDIAQNAVATYCAIGDRYPEEDNHLGILIGIFNKKCLEYIDGSRRESEKLRRYIEDRTNGSGTSRNGGLPPGSVPSAVEELIQREDCRAILSSITKLQPDFRQVIELLIEEGEGRKGLLRHFDDENKNTLDSRLHTARKKLRALLRARGIVI